MPTPVQPCGYDDVPPLASSLGRAFSDDPVFSHLIPGVGVDERARRLAPLFAGNIRVHRLFGEVWTTPDAAAGAIWTPPGRRIPRWRELAAGLAFARASWRRIPEGLRILGTIQQEHPKDPPHWYLAVLGTATERQGKGLGAAAMAPVLERCDREGVPAYLESSKESNIPFYERFGFKVLRELPLGKGAPSVWPMWREPA